MKISRILIAVLLSYIFLFGLLYLGLKDSITIWRELTSVSITIVSLLSLTFLYLEAQKHDKKIILKDGMLDIHGEEIELIYCDNCLAANKKGSLFCSNCNSDLRVVVCPICGNENPYDQQYCLNCDSILQNVGKHV